MTKSRFEPGFVNGHFGGCAMLKNNVSIRVLFLAHGGAACGMGHVVRSLSLASAFLAKGCDVQFISKYQEGIEEIRRQGYAVHVQEDINIIISRFKPHIVVVDTYQVSTEFFISLSQYSKVVYIDDLYTFDYPVDVIVNGNITALTMGYQYAFPEQKHLLGIEYNLIRSEFSNMSARMIKREVTHIMITTGASDPANMTCSLLDAIMKDDSLKHYHYNIVIGSGFQNQKTILQIAESTDHIHCYFNPLRMSEIMLGSDISISAGGSTLYELAACGTPTLAFIYADNQRIVTEKMAGEYLINLGYYKTINYGKFIYNLKKMITDEIFRKRISAKMQQLVDGSGSKRVADEIIAHCLSVENIRN